MNLLCGYIRHAYIDQIIFLQLRQTFQQLRGLESYVPYTCTPQWLCTTL